MSQLASIVSRPTQSRSAASEFDCDGVALETAAGEPGENYVPSRCKWLSTITLVPAAARTGQMPSTGAWRFAR